MVIFHSYVSLSEGNQCPFQDPKLEVPTIFSAYVIKAYVREYPHKIWPEKWY